MTSVERIKQELKFDERIKRAKQLCAEAEAWAPKTDQSRACANYHQGYADALYRIEKDLTKAWEQVFRPVPNSD